MGTVKMIILISISYYDAIHAGADMVMVMVHGEDFVWTMDEACVSVRRTFE